MQRKEFKTTIRASKEKIWKVLWEDKTYRQWTAPFSEGSHAKSDWEEGSKILFLGPDGNGMVSKIQEKRAPEFMSFEHLGIVKGGVEDTTSEEIKQWAGAKENYTLQTINTQTKLVAAVDIAEDHVDYFQNAFPKALQIVKELSEK